MIQVVAHTIWIVEDIDEASSRMYILSDCMLVHCSIVV
jgi:hypothetical protein